MATGAAMRGERGERNDATSRRAISEILLASRETFFICFLGREYDATLETISKSPFYTRPNTTKNSVLIRISHHSAFDGKSKLENTYDYDLRI